MPLNGFGMVRHGSPACRPTDLHAGRMHRKRVAQQRPHTERKERGGQGPAADGRCPRHEHEAAEERVDGRRQCLAAPLCRRPDCAGQPIGQGERGEVPPPGPSGRERGAPHRRAVLLAGGHAEREAPHPRRGGVAVGRDTQGRGCGRQCRHHQPQRPAPGAAAAERHPQHAHQRRECPRPVAPPAGAVHRHARRQRGRRLPGGRLAAPFAPRPLPCAGVLARPYATCCRPS